jgi:hypothetical protein
MEETGNTLAEGTMIFLASGESGHLQQTSNGIAFAQRLRKQFVAIQFAYLSNNWNGLQPINGVIRRIRKSVARPRNPTVLYNGTRSRQQAPAAGRRKRPAIGVQQSMSTTGQPLFQVWSARLSQIPRNLRMWKTCQASRRKTEVMTPHSTPLPPLYPQRYLAGF